MSALQRVVGVSPEIAGSAVVPEDELVKKLGRTAWLVWQVLVSKRSRDGVCRCYGTALTQAKGFEHVTKNAAAKAMRRLEQAGLVERIGYQNLPTVTRVGVRTLSVHTRRVLGARALHLLGCSHQVVVPAITARWINSATAWGGARKGAGKRPQKRDDERSVSFQVASPIAFSRGIPCNVYKQELCMKGLTEVSFPSERKTCAADAATFSSPGLEIANELGSALVGRAKAPGLTVTNLPSGVPPYPGQSVVQPAYVPHPPTLRAGMKPAEVVQMLLASLVGALEAFHDVRLPRRKSPSVKKADRLLLLTAGEHLLAHNIPPAVWCWWRLQRYAGSLKKAPGARRPSHPPLAFVFAERMLTEQRWQFRAVWGDGLLGGRALLGKRHRELLLLFRQMAAEMNSGAASLSAVAKFFPGDTYDRLVDEARVEAATMQNKIHDQIRRGAFVWQP